MIQKKKKYKLADFDYALPKKYIAQYPGDKRDQCKLMVVNKEAKTIEHKKFSNRNMAGYMFKNNTTSSSLSISTYRLWKVCCR